MRRLSVLFAALSLIAAPALAADAAHPSVIELFQSQGCFSCPPANENVMALADRPDLLVLSFNVTYWDRLGWKDRFAKPEFTQRQYAYRDGLHHDNVWTPQTVINGRVDVTGIRAAELGRAVTAGARTDATPSLTETAGRIDLGAGTGKADVWLVRYDPKIVAVPVRAGENAGRTLPHWADVVALAVQAHEAFPQRVVVGWDVAMLSDGATIIEGNGKPDLDIHQRAERGPAGESRIAHLLAYNVDKRS
jgi:hypothetical protein